MSISHLLCALWGVLWPMAAFSWRPIACDGQTGQRLSENRPFYVGCVNPDDMYDLKAIFLGFTQILGSSEKCGLTFAQIKNAATFCANYHKGVLVSNAALAKDRMHLGEKIKQAQFDEKGNALNLDFGAFALPKSVLGGDFIDAQTYLAKDDWSTERVGLDYDGRLVYPKKGDLHASVRGAEYDTTKMAPIY